MEETKGLVAIEMTDQVDQQKKKNPVLLSLFSAVVFRHFFILKDGLSDNCPT